jgi:ADP-dependent NAD(P)H-hydrate dehydratase
MMSLMTIQFVTNVPLLPKRAPHSHKGTFGKVLVVAGSCGMSGAAVLTGTTALRGGAGLVTLAVPEGILRIVAAMEPALMTVGLPETSRGQISIRAIPQILSLAASANSLACGPGWGHSASTSAVGAALYLEAPVPAVFDADALNGLADRFRSGPFPSKAARVLTPHPGEFARLTGLDAKAIQSNRDDHAAEFASRHGVMLVLKGHETVVTDGKRVAINSTGNPGLATGGSGDVLTGLIAALLAGGMPAFDAAQLGVHVHGAAGDMVAGELSQPGLIASDLPRAIGRVLADAGSPSS